MRQGSTVRGSPLQRAWAGRLWSPAPLVRSPLVADSREAFDSPRFCCSTLPQLTGRVQDQRLQGGAKSVLDGESRSASPLARYAGAQENSWRGSPFLPLRSGNGPFLAPLSVASRPYRDALPACPIVGLFAASPSEPQGLR